MQATMGGSGGAVVQVPLAASGSQVKYEDVSVQLSQNQSKHISRVTSSAITSFGRIVEEIYGFYTKPLRPEAPPELEPEVFDWEPCEEDEGEENVPSTFSDEAGELEEEGTFQSQPRPIEQIIRRYTLTNSNGLSVQVINYGATIISIRMPDKYGIEDDIVLGFDDLDGYLSEENQYFGGMIGRVAGIIPGGEFKIGKREIYLSNNLDENHFHGGIDGFDKVVWDSYIQNGKVIMTYISKDREEGYPGPLFIQVSFQLTRRNQFIVEITANPAKPTPIAITPHIYFNLAGHGEGPDGLKEHCLMVNADRFVVTDFETNIPTGEMQDVGGTYYDLRVPRPLEKILNNVPGGGYDHTFCLTKGGAKNNITFSARLVHPISGRFLEVYTDNPGLHIYTADRLPNPDRPVEPDPKLGIDVFCVADFDEYDGEYVEEFARKWPEDGEWPRPISAPEEEHVFPTYSETMATRLADEDAVLGAEDTGEDEGLPSVFQSEEKMLSEEEEVDSWQSPDEIAGKMGASYRNHGGICLMPGQYPNAVNNERFPSPIIYPGQTYKRTIVYSFGIVPQRKQRKLTTIVDEVRGKHVAQE